jgi:hypothetical protein
MVPDTQEYRSAIWVAVVSFVFGFVASFYGNGIKQGWFKELI